MLVNIAIFIFSIISAFSSYNQTDFSLGKSAFPVIQFALIIALLNCISLAFELRGKYNDETGFKFVGVLNSICGITNILLFAITLLINNDDLSVVKDNNIYLLVINPELNFGSLNDFFKGLDLRVYFFAYCFVNLLNPIIQFVNSHFQEKLVKKLKEKNN